MEINKAMVKISEVIGLIEKRREWFAILRVAAGCVTPEYNEAGED